MNKRKELAAKLVSIVSMVAGVALAVGLMPPPAFAGLGGGAAGAPAAAPALTISPAGSNPDAKAVPEGCIAFTSDKPFKISLGPNKNWNGTIECSLDGSTWSEYTAGTPIDSAPGRAVFFRGTDNTRLSEGNGPSWHSTFSLAPADGHAVSCSGNVETLLNYKKVLAGEHPDMDAHAFSPLGYENQAGNPSRAPAAVNRHVGGNGRLGRARSLGARTCASTPQVRQAISRLCSSQAIPEHRDWWAEINIWWARAARPGPQASGLAVRCGRRGIRARGPLHQRAQRFAVPTQNFVEQRFAVSAPHSFTPCLGRRYSSLRELQKMGLDKENSATKSGGSPREVACFDNLARGSMRRSLATPRSHRVLLRLNICDNRPYTGTGDSFDAE